MQSLPTLVKTVGENFIPDYCNRGARSGPALNEYGDKWGFIAKEWGLVSGWKITKKRHQGEGIRVKWTQHDSS